MVLLTAEWLSLRTTRSTVRLLFSPIFLPVPAFHSFAQRPAPRALQELHPRQGQAGPLVAALNGYLARIGVRKSNINSSIWAAKRYELQLRLALRRADLQQPPRH